GLRIAVLDQPFGRGSEIIEDILLVFLHPGAVPFFSELSAAAQVGQRKNATMLSDYHRIGAKLRCLADQESSIAIKKRRPFAIELQALLVNQEHGNTRF